MAKRPQEVIEQDGEQYMHATAIAKRLGISRPLFYVNIIKLLDAQYLSGRKTKYYKVTQVEQQCKVNIMQTFTQHLPTSHESIQK